MKRSANRAPLRGADFLAGVLAEPLLAFGGSQEHVDPKTGLALYGPYCPPGLVRPTLSNMIVGAVGPAAMVADAAAWVDACRGIITNSGAQPFLYPHFPGCRQSQLPFYCDLLFRDQWCETIRDIELKRALAEPIFENRLMAVINLYMAGLETLKGREPQPDVVVLCLPQEVVDRCAVVAPGDQHVVMVKRLVKPAAVSRQLELAFPEPETDDEGEPVHRNLRRGLKARAMQHGLPTQIVWPRTLRLAGDDGGGRGSRKSQDAATRAWNFITALYHKAGGIPWRLRHVDPGVCFVGVFLLPRTPRTHSTPADKHGANLHCFRRRLCPAGSNVRLGRARARKLATSGFRSVAIFGA